MKILCKCGKIATWIYMPSEYDGNYCDNCVPRGCSCNIEQTQIIDIEGAYVDYPDKELKQSIDWDWIKKGITWQYLDNGKAYPCCEFWYHEEGFEYEN